MKNKANKENKIKILIAGIGGVGGFFGGLLAEAYESSKEIEIYFLARGKHLTEIQKNGLQIQWGDRSFIGRPKLATDDANVLDEMDVVIVATKTYDLESICRQIKPCISEKTIFLPLLNGVNNIEIIQEIYPKSTALSGCVYLISKIIAAGKIENAGNIQSLYFGAVHNTNYDLKKLESIFKEAKIEAHLSEEITKVIWEKFIFLSAIATATSYFDNTIGKIIESEDKKRILAELTREVIALASSLQIDLQETIFDKTMQKFASLPSKITSSMHRDYIQGKTKTEIESLTGYVVREAAKQNIKVKSFKLLHTELKRRI